MTKEELIRTFENMDKNQLANAARKCFNDVVNGIHDATGDADFAFQFACSIVANVVAIDGKLSIDEFTLFGYILGQENLDFAATKDFLQQYVRTDIIQNISKCLDNNQQLKLNACTLGFAVAAIDGHVSVEENKLLTYLVG